MSHISDQATFPSPERIARVFEIIQPVLDLAMSGVCGIFSRRKRNAMFLRAQLCELRRLRNLYQSSGDYCHLKKGMQALRLATIAAMKGAYLDTGPANTTNFWIVLSMLDAGILRPDEWTGPNYGDIPFMSEHLLRNMEDTHLREHGISLFRKAA